MMSKLKFLYTVGECRDGIIKRINEGGRGDIGGTVPSSRLI